MEVSFLDVVRLLKILFLFDLIVELNSLNFSLQRLSENMIMAPSILRSLDKKLIF